MLKSELEKRLKETEENSAHYLKENGILTRAAKTKDEENEALRNNLSSHYEQLKQIGQSIYTMLEVKYPDRYINNQNNDRSEDEIFLTFLHGLCVANDFNMGRSNVKDFMYKSLKQ